MSDILSFLCLFYPCCRGGASIYSGLPFDENLQYNLLRLLCACTFETFNKNLGSATVITFLLIVSVGMGQVERAEVKLDGGSTTEPGDCHLCSLVKGREFKPVDIMPGGSILIVRESPTSAFVRFTAGSVEPAHHHTFGHDLVVLKGSKRVWNLSKGEKYDLGVGDYLFTPAGDVHRVKYFEDTDFFIKWEGQWDLLLDEDHAAANAAIDKEMEN